MILKILLLCLLWTFVLSSESYYDILGVSRSATDLDIKKAYKKLAKEWHPDKNKQQDAQERFMKITEAYEVLSNSQKRQEYDAFGSVSNENMHSRYSNPFEMFENQFFGFHEESFSSHQFQTVTYRTFMMDILPASRREPVLLLLVTQMCFYCSQALRFWNHLNDHLSNTGVKLTVADIIRDSRLQEQIKVHSVPKVVLIIDEEVRYYQGSFRLDEVVQFIRANFPRDLIKPIRSVSELQRFHDAWMQDSRVRMVLMKPLDKPSIRYLCGAFRFRDKVAAGFINIESSISDVREIASEYNARINEETLVLFHTEKIVTSQLPRIHRSIRTPKLSVSQMNEMLSEPINSRLPLPRLTSQRVFDELCPSPSRDSVNHHSFCIILVLDELQYAANLSLSHSYTSLYSLSKLYPNVPSVFLYAKSQMPFLQSLNLLPDGDVNGFADRVILLWRFNYNSAFSAFLTDPFSHDSGNLVWVLQNVHIIQDNPSDLPESLGAMPVQSGALESLVDELEAPLWLRIVWRLGYYVWSCVEFGKELLEDPWTILLTGVTLFFTYYMYQSIASRIRDAVNMESTDHMHRQSRMHANQASLDQRIKKFTLSREYYDVLLLSKTPGKMQAILFCTGTTPTTVFLQFLNSIHKLNSRTIEPLLLYLDQHPKWLSSVLSNLQLETLENGNQANGDERGSSSNLESVTALLKRISVNSTYSCEGNVMVTNLTRHYFFICPINLMQQHNHRQSAYSPMLHESDQNDGDNNDGDSQVEVKLHDWLSQLLDGACKKFRVQQWPPHLS